MNHRILSIVSLLVIGVGIGPAMSQDLPEKAGPARTAKLFELFCFNQLPDIGAIAKIAKAGNFTPLQGAELQKYQPQVPADELNAWKFQDLAGQFVLITSKGKPDEAMKKELPEFANSTSFACTLYTPSKDPSAGTLAEMTKVMDRKPDQSWDQAPLHVDYWVGQAEKLHVNIYHYSAIKTKKTILLNGVTFVNK